MIRTINRCGPVPVIMFGIAMMLSFFGATPAPAQSFNCRYARAPDEVLICQDAYLSRLDGRMASLYFDRRNTTYGVDRERLEASQARWLTARQQCGRDRDCIAYWYRRRIAELQNW